MVLCTAFAILHLRAFIFFRAVRKAGGRIPQKRSGATACVRGHNLYMYGGHTISDKTSELCWLDLERLCWREIPDAPTRPIDMPSPRDKTASWTYAQRYCQGRRGVVLNIAVYASVCEFNYVIFTVF